MQKIGVFGWASTGRESGHELGFFVGVKHPPPRRQPPDINVAVMHHHTHTQSGWKSGKLDLWEGNNFVIFSEDPDIYVLGL